MWNCANCYQLIEENFKFCWKCGSANPAKAEAQTGDASELLKRLPFILWALAVVSVLTFIALSYTKMSRYESRIADEAVRLSHQNEQFVFPAGQPTQKGNIKGKVLPLDIKDKEPNFLYYGLPDDLRPASAEEVGTILWLDCKFVVHNVYTDGTRGFQQQCRAHLVDKETSKVIGVEDFLGAPPSKPRKSNRDFFGDQPLAELVAYIRKNQLPEARDKAVFVSDSSNHHILVRFEIVYAFVALLFLGAIGFGWVSYKTKYNLDIS